MTTKLAFALAAILVAPAAASAATLDLPIGPDAVFFYDDILQEFVYFGGDYSFGVQIDPATGGLGDFGGELTYFGPDGYTLEAVGFGADFGAGTNSDQFSFTFAGAGIGPVTASFFGEFGTSLATLSAEFALVDTPVIPLPMPALLLPTALAGLAFARRRKPA